MQSPSPASELSAVNELLAAIGESPLESLDVLPPSVHTALEVIRNTSRDFQGEGHWFCRESDYVLTPSASGEITIPDNVASIDGASEDVIERRPRLYNRETRSFTFTGPVTCDVVLILPWDQVPPVARRYITAMATEKFVDGFPGANAVTEARHRNLIRAKAAFEREVIRNEDLNLLNNSTIQQLIRR